MQKRVNLLRVFNTFVNFEIQIIIDCFETYDKTPTVTLETRARFSARGHVVSFDVMMGIMIALQLTS